MFEITREEFIAVRERDAYMSGYAYSFIESHKKIYMKAFNLTMLDEKQEEKLNRHFVSHFMEKFDIPEWEAKQLLHVNPDHFKRNHQ